MLNARTLGETIYFMFTTRSLAGVPTTLAGTPVLSLYKFNSVTPIGTTADSWLNLTVDFDAITGLNSIQVVCTAANGFQTETEYTLVVTTGTVDSVSVVGEIVDRWELDFQKKMADAAFVTAGLSPWYTSLAVSTGTGIATTFSATALSANLGADTLLGATVKVLTSADASNVGATRVITGFATGPETVTVYPGFPAPLVAGDTVLIKYDSLVAATDIVSAGAITTLSGAVVNVDLADTLTTYTGNTPQTDDVTTAINDLANATDGLGAIKAETALILADTGTTLPATLATIAGYIDTEIAAILLDTGTTLDTKLTAIQAVTDLLPNAGALNNLSAAQVNAEVLDVLATDTFPEPAAVPAAIATLEDKISYIYTYLRNKTTQTATTKTLRNDADDANIGAATVSDDGTTFTKGEMI